MAEERKKRFPLFVFPYGHPKASLEIRREEFSSYQTVGGKHLRRSFAAREHKRQHPAAKEGDRDENVMLMLIFTAIALGTFAQSEEIDGVVWRYKLTSDEFGVVLTGNSTSDLSAIPRSTKGEVVLPSWIGDCPVVEIDQDAFYGCKYLTDINVTDDNLYFNELSLGGYL